MRIVTPPRYNTFEAWVAARCGGHAVSKSKTYAELWRAPDGQLEVWYYVLKSNDGEYILRATRPNPTDREIGSSEWCGARWRDGNTYIYSHREAEVLLVNETPQMKGGLVCGTGPPL